MHYKPLKQDADKNRVLVFVKPIMKTNKEVEDYAIYRGYAVEKLRYESNKKEHVGAKKLTQSLYEVYDTREDLSPIFKNEAKSDTAKKAELKDKICKGVDNCDNIDRTYDRIKEIIGSGDEDKQYIVRADSNLLRAIQCICFPAVKAWVDQWVDILTMLRNCLATVEIGKGDAGVCDQFISQVICDRIYELLKCFSSKIGWSGAGTRISGDFGIGSIIGILTNTASEMSKTMESRYGKSSMWNSLFNEKQLVHGVCMWAFGAKFDLKIEQIAEHMTEQIAIESQPIVTECKRYFRGYSPTTNPSGLTTWAYECGMAMIAGAKLNYQIKLQCSDDFSCAEKDGFRNNECDCLESGKKQITVERGTMERRDMFNKKFIWPIQAGRPNSKVRYDKAILYYEWIDPKTNEKRSNQAERYIYQSGAEPFGFCAFDPFSGAYRCQFGKQEGGISVKKINVNYKGSKHPTKKSSVFFIDQPFTFEAQVKQSIPDDPSKQKESKKFLYYRIENHAGQKVKEIKPDDPMDNTAAHVFASSGDYFEEISISLPETEIQKFLDVIPGKIPIGQIEIDGAKNKIDPTDYISSYEFKSTDKNISVIVEMTPAKLEIYQARSVRSFNKGTLLHSEDDYKLGLETYGTYQVELNINRKPEPGEIARIYLPVKKTGVSSPWNSGDPADWKIIFTVYDANTYGESTDQVSVSPDGIRQVKEVRFKVTKIRTADGIKEAEKPGAKPAEKPAATPATVKKPAAAPIIPEVTKEVKDLVEYVKTNAYQVEGTDIKSHITETKIGDSDYILSYWDSGEDGKFDNTINYYDKLIIGVKKGPGVTMFFDQGLNGFSDDVSGPDEYTHRDTKTKYTVAGVKSGTTPDWSSADKTKIHNMYLTLVNDILAAIKTPAKAPAAVPELPAADEYEIKTGDRVMSDHTGSAKFYLITKIQNNQVELKESSTDIAKTMPINDLKDNTVKLIRNDIWKIKPPTLFRFSDQHESFPDGYKAVLIEIPRLSVPTILQGTTFMQLEGLGKNEETPAFTDEINLHSKLEELKQRGITTKFIPD
jgi:hypothetical protein